jgi:hypothetical protein
MDSQLKQLYKHCQDIALEQPGNGYGVAGGEYQHYNSFQALQQSASEGCHLCTLLESAWIYNSTSQPFNYSNSVLLNLTRGLNGILKLKVHYQKRTAELMICDTYPKNCTDKSQDMSFYTRLDKKGNRMTPLYAITDWIYTKLDGETSFQGYPFLKSNNGRMREVRWDRRAHYFKS